MTEKQRYNKCICAVMKAFGDTREQAIATIENNIKEIVDLGGSREEALKELEQNVDDGLLSV